MCLVKGLRCLYCQVGYKPKSKTEWVVVVSYFLYCQLEHRKVKQSCLMKALGYLYVVVGLLFVLSSWQLLIAASGKVKRLYDVCRVEE
mmetsp:Transcript_19822/g.32927  ORF Transcript_19822/g.32927 Transcript_19822/m.32927 type:complete len:88 (+) Transcript_19822:79-342(+)